MTIYKDFLHSRKGWEKNLKENSITETHSRVFIVASTLTDDSTTNNISIQKQNPTRYFTDCSVLKACAAVLPSFKKTTRFGKIHTHAQTQYTLLNFIFYYYYYCSE